MAMALDVTTVLITKLKALLPGDQTYKLREYLNTEIADATSVARKDLCTRVWLDLPHT